MAGIAGLAAGALAAGVIASAVSVPGPGFPGNVIGAGHLQVAVNEGQGSNLDFANLAPGDSRSGDQLITGDMAGVGTAALTLELSDVAPGPFADAATMTISYSDPIPESDATVPGSAGGSCSPPGGLQHSTAAIPLTHLGGSYRLGTLTPGDTAVCVRYRITLDPSADNSAQGASTALSLTYSLTQTGAT